VTQLFGRLTELIYTMDIKHPTIILEVIIFYDCWIWHAFFGVTDSNNEINVLNQSLLFVDVIRGHTH
jgi:hypothetical protein